MRRSPIACDVEHRDQIEAAVAQVVERWGGIDLVVNNAQNKVYQSIRRLTDADMETMWQSGPMATLPVHAGLLSRISASRRAA